MSQLARAMSDLDEALEGQPVAPPTMAGAVGRKCGRHQWVTRTVVMTPDFIDPDRVGLETVCARCRVVRDETRARRGRSSRRLGHDGERRSEKRYGWRKTGEFGGIDDLVGKLFIVQQKTTRAAAPIRWKGIFARLEERAAGRIPAILLSFVKAGVDTEDFILIRGRDWLALHGKDEPE